MRILSRQVRTTSHLSGTFKKASQTPSRSFWLVGSAVLPGSAVAQAGQERMHQKRALQRFCCKGILAALVYGALRRGEDCNAMGRSGNGAGA